jgi:hypothetical protein
MGVSKEYKGNDGQGRVRPPPGSCAAAYAWKRYGGKAASSPPPPLPQAFASPSELWQAEADPTGTHDTW